MFVSIFVCHGLFIMYFELIILFIYLLLGKGNQTDVKQEPPPRMPIRRNLSASLPPQSPRTIAKTQVFEEGLFPLQCTPEPPQKTVQAMSLSSSSTVDPNMTFEVMDIDDQVASNATIIISSGSPCQASKSTDVLGPSQLLHPPKTNEGNQIPNKRWKKYCLRCLRMYKLISKLLLRPALFLPFSIISVNLQDILQQHHLCFGTQNFACVITQQRICSHVQRIHFQVFRHIL